MIANQHYYTQNSLYKYKIYLLINVCVCVLINLPNYNINRLIECFSTDKWNLFLIEHRVHQFII